MAGHVDHVIHASGNPVITVSISASAVSSEISAGELAEVGLEETLMIAIDCAHLAGPTVEHDEITRRFSLKFTPFAVHDGGSNAEEWQCR